MANRADWARHALPLRRRRFSTIIVIVFFGRIDRRITVGARRALPICYEICTFRNEITFYRIMASIFYIIIMKYSLLFAILALLVFACGEVGETPSNEPSSSGGDPAGSSSSDPGDGGGSSSSRPSISSSSNPICQTRACCAGNIFDEAKDFCFEDELYSKCGGETFNPNWYFCPGNKLYLKCDDEEYDLIKEFCFENQLYQKCSGEEYNPEKQGCDDNGKLYKKCFGRPFDEEKYFCVDEELYPKCDKEEYDPYKKGCFNEVLYDKCTLETTLGVCVHNSLLRCRQLGQGEDKIRDPIPGMECEEDGSIIGTVKDYRDGRIYKTAQIGNQVWLAENLDYYPGPNEQGGEIVRNSMCYSGIPGNCTQYGRLYDWATAMNLPRECNGKTQGCIDRQGAALIGGLCPAGFAVPRSEDWRILANYAGGGPIAGGRLKSKDGWSGNGNGTDSYGFDALPGGYAAYWGDESRDLGNSSMWWTDTEPGPAEATYWRIISEDTEARTHFQMKGMYMGYLRCLHY